LSSPPLSSGRLTKSSAVTSGVDTRIVPVGVLTNVAASDCTCWLTTNCIRTRPNARSVLVDDDLERLRALMRGTQELRGREQTRVVGATEVGRHRVDEPRCWHRAPRPVLRRDDHVEAARRAEDLARIESASNVAALRDLLRDASYMSVGSETAASE
jgi:hypothetical protein